MTYTRFKEIWTTTITNRAPAEKAANGPALHNGVSDTTVDALVAVTTGDHSAFEQIQSRLAHRDQHA